MAKERHQRFRSADEALGAIEDCLKKHSAAEEPVIMELSDEAKTQAIKESDLKQQELRQPTLQPVLIFTHGSEPGRRISLSEEETVFGRASICDVQIQQPWFSRRHFVILKKGFDWLLDDLESRNGTFVNGARVLRCVLQLGDVIAVRDTRFVFELERSKPTGMEHAQSELQTTE